MPFIYGKIYPEVESAGLLNHTFKALIELRENKDFENFLPFIKELCTLKIYLNDIADSPAHLELSVPPTLYSGNSNTCKELGLTPVKLTKDTPDYNEKIKLMAEFIDADLVVTENKEVIDFFNKETDLHFLVENRDEAKKNIEVFVRGHEVPWSFSDPCWNMPWSTFHSLSDKFGRKAYEIYEAKFRKIGLYDDTIEVVRSLLLNRVSHICYTRDKLLFYVQQRNYAKRHNWKRQSFQFETSYYLCYYYVLLWGGIDQLSRILNNSLNLGVTRFSQITIAREDFVAKVISVDENLGNLYKDEKFLKWIEQLRRNRHFTAHQGSIILSPIVKKTESEPSDEELEKEAQATPTWNFMKRTLSPEIFERYRAALKQQIRISKYKVLVDDAMVMQDGEQKLIFRPLTNIEWDFSNFELITLNTLQALYEVLQKRRLKK
ncbi:MAG: hypothetical protein WBD28_05535 [Candidatus Zixiibacteriota bacterium]